MWEIPMKQSTAVHARREKRRGLLVSFPTNNRCLISRGDESSWSGFLTLKKKWKLKGAQTLQKSYPTHPCDGAPLSVSLSQPKDSCMLPFPISSQPFRPPNSDLTLNITETKREIYTHISARPPARRKKLILSCALYLIGVYFLLKYITRHQTFKLQKPSADASWVLENLACIS
jgi:hypothetical protein